MGKEREDGQSAKDCPNDRQRQTQFYISIKDHSSGARPAGTLRQFVGFPFSPHCLLQAKENVQPFPVSRRASIRPVYPSALGFSLSTTS